jgi:hypothetical protein
VPTAVWATLGESFRGSFEPTRKGKLQRLLLMTGTAEYGASVAGAGSVVPVVTTLLGAAGAAATGIGVAMAAFALQLLHELVPHEPLPHELVPHALQVLHEFEWKSPEKARRRRSRIGNIGRCSAAQPQLDVEHPLLQGEAAAQDAQVRGAHVVQGLAAQVEQAQGFGITTARGWQ